MPWPNNRVKLLRYNGLTDLQGAGWCLQTMTVCQAFPGRLRSAPYGQR